MEPRIQYAKTKDGVSIAYSTLGVGTRLYRMTYEQADSGDGDGRQPGVPSPRPAAAGLGPGRNKTGRRLLLLC